MKFIISGLIALTSSIAAYAGTALPPSDDDVLFSRSTVVAVVKVMQSELIPTEQGGGIKSKVKVLTPIKGLGQDAELDVYNGAGAVGGTYVAVLEKDAHPNGYHFVDPSLSVELFAVTAKEQNPLKPGEKSLARGFIGDPIAQKTGEYYLPVCSAPASDSCQRQFEHVQFFLSKLKQ